MKRIVLLTFIIFPSLFSCNHPTEKKEATETKKELTSMQSAAADMAQYFVRTRVFSCIVISQPVVPESVTDNGNRYEVVSSFLAKSPKTGDTQTYRYTLQITYNGGAPDSSSSWDATSFVVGDRDLLAEAVAKEGSSASTPEPYNDRQLDSIAIARIKAKAKEEYPGDYSLQEFSYKQDVKAYRYMKTVKDMELKQRAELEYPDDYSLQKFSYDQEVKAKAHMNE